MTYQLNLFEGVQLCLNVDTANSADETYPSTISMASGATSVYNDTPSAHLVTPATGTSTYQTTDTGTSSQHSVTEQWWWRLYNSVPNGVL